MLCQGALFEPRWAVDTLPPKILIKNTKHPRLFSSFNRWYLLIPAALSSFGTAAFPNSPVHVLTPTCPHKSDDISSYLVFIIRETHRSRFDSPGSDELLDMEQKSPKRRLMAQPSRDVCVRAKAAFPSLHWAVLPGEYRLSTCTTTHSLQ